MKRHIRLRGVNGDVEGLVWENEAMLRAGRLASLEMVLDDSSVSRRHAEIRSTANGWRIRDLGSTNGTFLNGNRLGPGEWPIRAHDILRFGNVTVVVDLLRENGDDHLKEPTEHLLVSATATSYEDALSGLAFFALGSQYWGWCYGFGLSFFGLGFLMSEASRNHPST